MSNKRVDKHWFAGVLRDLMAEKKVSITQMAEKLDIDEDTISLLLDGTMTPRLRLAERILKFLGYEFEVMPAKK